PLRKAGFAFRDHALGGSPRTYLDIEHRLAGHRIRDPDPFIQDLENVPHLVELGDHLRPGLHDPVEIVPLANEAIGTLAGLDDDDPAQTGLGHALNAFRIDVAVVFQIIGVAAGLYAHADNVESGHFVLPVARLPPFLQCAAGVYRDCAGLPIAGPDNRAEEPKSPAPIEAGRHFGNGAGCARGDSHADD